MGWCEVEPVIGSQLTSQNNMLEVYLCTYIYLCRLS